jgi:hypothetical protein
LDHYGSTCFVQARISTCFVQARMGGRQKLKTKSGYQRALSKHGWGEGKNKSHTSTHNQTKPWNTSINKHQCKSISVLHQPNELDIPRNSLNSKLINACGQQSNWDMKPTKKFTHSKLANISGNWNMNLTPQELS